jgi:hypothetical protein
VLWTPFRARPGVSRLVHGSDRRSNSSTAIIRLLSHPRVGYSARHGGDALAARDIIRSRHSKSAGAVGLLIRSFNVDSHPFLKFSLPLAWSS